MLPKRLADVIQNDSVASADPYVAQRARAPFPPAHCNFFKREGEFL